MAKFKKALMEAFKPHFKGAGFKKKGATWHRQSVEAIHVFNIQTSQWSESYYFNVGVYFRALGSEMTPPEYHCHIRTRIPDLEYHPKKVERVNELADFEKAGKDVERRILELKDIVFPLAIEWFQRFQDVRHTKRELAGKGPRSFWIDPEVWILVGLKMPD